MPALVKVEVKEETGEGVRTRARRAAPIEVVVLSDDGDDEEQTPSK